MTPSKPKPLLGCKSIRPLLLSFLVSFHVSSALMLETWIIVELQVFKMLLKWLSIVSLFIIIRPVPLPSPYGKQSRIPWKSFDWVFEWNEIIFWCEELFFSDRLQMEWNNGKSKWNKTIKMKIFYSWLGLAKMTKQIETWFCVLSIKWIDTNQHSCAIFHLTKNCWLNSKALKPFLQQVVI